MLSGKVIIVTGGAGLIGSEFCRVIAREGAAIVIADIDLASAKLLRDEIIECGCKAEAAYLDINELKSIDELIQSVSKKHGRIDSVVNNAYPRNAQYGRKLEDVTYADFCENVNSHLGGYFLVAQSFAKYFKSVGVGNIVNMASIYGVISPKFDIYENTLMTMPVEYAAVKAAVISLTRYFASYYKSDGLRVNAISPGGIFDNQDTSFVESYSRHCGKKGMLDVGDITGGLLYLLSDSSMQMTGQNMVIDSGFSL